MAANSIPFFVLGSLVLVQGQPVFWLTTVLIVLIAGLGIWLFGKKNTQHIGASGLILGDFVLTLTDIAQSTQQNNGLVPHRNRNPAAASKAQSCLYFTGLNSNKCQPV
jgi:hypothetical protein